MDKIYQPADISMQVGVGKVTLRFDGNFAQQKTSMFAQIQRIVDSEVLRYDAPLMPIRTGTLIKSGTIGTVIGSGIVTYATPYARYQYYATAQSRPYDANRGGRWFERMKSMHKDDILRAAKGGA